MFSRRKLLKVSGAAVAGLGFASGQVGATDSSSRGWKGVEESPPSGVDVEAVTYGFSEDPTVNAGAWVNHEFGFVFLEETEAAARNRLEELEFTVKLDGDTLEDPKEYFGEIRELSDEESSKYNYRVDFDAYTPPQTPGEHTFYTKYTQPNGVSFSGEIVYEVTPGR